MKVLIVNGSSHVNGTTMQAIKEVQKVFTEANVDTEVIHHVQNNNRIEYNLESAYYQVE